MRITELSRSLRKNQTKAESFFWKKTRNRKLFDLKFNRQFAIEHTNINGRKSFYIADFYCHEKNVSLKLMVVFTTTKRNMIR